jgi:hypothetical protein
MSVARVKKWDDSREIEFTPPEAWDLAVGQGGSLIWTVKPGETGSVTIPIGTSDEQVHTGLPDGAMVVISGTTVGVKG